MIKNIVDVVLIDLIRFQELPVLVRFLIGLGLFVLAPSLGRKLRVPSVVILILFGVLLGPSGLDLTHHDGPVIMTFGELGKLLLLFFAGLEIDLEQFKRDKWRSLGFGSATFLFPLAAGTTVGLLFGYNAISSVLIGSLLASHTLLGFPIVTELGMGQRTSVVVTVGATILTDVLSLLVLAICVSLHVSGFDPVSLTLQIVELGLFMFVILAGMSRVTNWLLHRIESKSETQLMVLLGIVLVSSLLAEAIHLEPIVGAFFAGLAVNNAMAHSSARKHIEVIGNSLFVPAFFFSIGLMLDVSSVTRIVSQETLFVSSVVAALVVGKFLAAWIAGWLSGYERDDRLLIWSLSLPQVAATLAAALVSYQTVDAAGVRLIDYRALSSVLVLMLVTAIFGPMLTGRYAHRLRGDAAVATTSR